MKIIEIDATPQRRGSYLIYVDREPVVLQGRLFSALVKLACARSHSGGWTRYSDLVPDPEGTGRNAQIVIHALRRILGFDRRELEVNPCVVMFVMLVINICKACHNNRQPMLSVSSNQARARYSQASL